MAQPTFRAVGTLVATTTTTLSLVAPTVAKGDCLVAIVATNDNTAPSGIDARWVSIVADNDTAALRTNIYVLPNAALTDSGATFNFTIAGTTVGAGFIASYSNCSSAQPVQKSSSPNASSATITFAAYTQSATKSLILGLASYLLTGGTNQSLTGAGVTFTNRSAQSTATGSGMSLYLYDATGLGAGTSLAAGSIASGLSAAVNEGAIVELIGTQDSSSGQPSGGVVYGALDRTVRIAG